MYRENPADSSLKRFVIIIPFVVLTFFLMGSYYNLQIVEHDKFLSVANKNIIRSIDLLPTRGDIYDRKKRLIVDSRPAFSIYIQPKLFKNDTLLQQRLSKLIDDSLATELMKSRLEKRRYSPLEKILVKRHISDELMSQIVENKKFLPGVWVDVDPKRNRAEDIKASHTLGYVKEINEQQLKENPFFKRGDVIGKKGVERRYNNELFGTRGYKSYVADAYGNPVKALDDEFGTEERAIDGKDLYLTLDVDLQRLAEKRLEGKRGAIVVLDAKTSGILAIASAPTYSPELLSKPISTKDWKWLTSEEEGKPLLNRTVHGIYPPGSVYKMVALIAGLNEGYINRKWKVECTGGYSIGDRVIHCWNRKGHGEVNAITAISGSCNVYFFHLIQKIGLDKWAEYSRAFGFGSKTGVDLPIEYKGLVPTSQFYKGGKHYYTTGKLLNLSIGQGELLTTPLQVAHYTLMLANKGRFKKPHLLSGMAEKYSKTIIPKYYRDYDVPIKISDKVWKTVFRGMNVCVNGEFQTGRFAKLEDIIVAGKTGTAQVPPKKSHSWFTAFAPLKNPEIVVTVLVEHGGGGGAVAAPITRMLLEQYFYGKVLPPKPVEDLVPDEPIILPEPVLPTINVTIPYEIEDH